MPVGGLVAAFDVKGVLHDLHSERDDAVTQQVLDQCRGLLVRKWVGSCGACGLDVEFLGHLHRERVVGDAEDRFGYSGFFRFLRLGGDGVWQDVGIYEGHLPAAFVKVLTGQFVPA